MGHMEQYAPGTTFVYSHLLCRSDKKFSESLFFGLQYYLEKYLARPLYPWMAGEFLEVHRQVVGEPSKEVQRKVRALCNLGYWPLKIRAVPEGSIVPVRNVLMTICNTEPGFHWCVGFVESLLLKVWYPTTVATHSLEYRRLAGRYFDQTCDSRDGLSFAVHDFGYRGDQSEEGAGISGAAHLVNFIGSDTIPAHPFVKLHYSREGEGGTIMASVPASEHSVMCSFGREDELAAFRHMLRLYPRGIVSIVSDTYSIWRVLSEFAPLLKDEILARDGKVVFRPDSGDPVKVICGDYSRDPVSCEFAGCLRMLADQFGYQGNSRGFDVINPKVGLIYGDGMFLERYETALARMATDGFAASNLIIGVGGILRHHTRDTLGFAIKATACCVDGQMRHIEKDPVTDPGKKSLAGFMRLDYSSEFGWQTTDRLTAWDAEGGRLESVFKDGKLLRRQSLNEIRQLAGML